MNVNEEDMDCKIRTMYVELLVGGGEGEWRTLRWGYMVDGLQILIWSRTKKPFSIALSGAGKG
jgi:hypothetical protein